MHSDIQQRVALKAVITNSNNEVLVLREASTYDEGTNIGRYGIPGGRLAPGELWEDGLRREVAEETGLQIEILRPLYVGEWRPIIKGIPHQIIAIFMECKTDDTVPTLSDEHDVYKWVNSDSWQTLNMLYPDSDVLRTYFAQ